MNYLRVKCFTEEEGHEKTIWPPVLAALPNEGNYINGVLDGKHVRLRVKEISHGLTSHQSLTSVDQVPMVEIRLAK